MSARTVDELHVNAQNCPKYERIGTDSSPLLTIAECLSFTRMSERQFYKMRANGRGPRVVRMDGKVMIFKSEAMQWLNGCEEPAPGVLPPLYTRSCWRVIG